MPIAGAVLAAFGLTTAAWGGPATAVGPVVAGTPVALLGRARATVDRRGLTVAFGPLRWPRLHVPAADVASAKVADVSPAQFGGWGYSVVPSGRGVITCSGPALVVTRRSLKVSIHTVRAGYQQLRDEGLIELRRGRGATVRAGHADGRARSSTWRGGSSTLPLGWPRRR